jgi:hypothetical protein
LIKLARSWTALVWMKVRFGRFSSVKMRQLSFLGTPESRLRLRALDYGLPLRGVQHRYPVVIGDARTLHIEVNAPDPEAVRLVPWRSAVEIGRQVIFSRHARSRIFETEHSNSREVQAFYTIRDAEAIEHEIARLAHERHKSAPTMLHRANQGTMRLRVTFKPHRSIGAFYLLTTIFAAFVAWWLSRAVGLGEFAPAIGHVHLTNWLYHISLPWISRVPRQSPGRVEATIATVAVGLLATQAAVRERSSITGLLFRRVKILFLIFFSVILWALAVALIHAKA